MKEHKGNNGKFNNNDEKRSKTPIKLEGNLQKITTPKIITEKDNTIKDRDIILKNKYSATLKSSAENFLVDLFEKISTMSNFENVNLEVPISAAMAIITNTSWHQPTEAQIEYDFTRECIDKGLYEFSKVLDFELELEDEMFDEEDEIDGIIDGISGGLNDGTSDDVDNNPSDDK
jgi:hypothetical protein